MPTIRPSADLRNKYSEISEYCHKYDEPVYLTKNGKGDLVVQSIEAYEKLLSKLELYELIDKGIDDINAGNGSTIEDAFKQIEEEM